MQLLKTRKFLLLMLIIVVAVIVIEAFLRHDVDSLAFIQQEKTGNDKNDKENLPLAIFSDPQPNDQIRHTRSSRYDGRLPKPLNEMRDSGLMRITHWWINLPGLPTAESNAVVLGKVVAASAYLSNDKSNVYSEFTIQVEEIFKDESGSLNLSGTVVALREGGRVQLPDGRILYVMSDQGLPRKEWRYVFFLKYNSSANDYNIITGYLLNQGIVSLLDEVDLGRFSTYKNMDEQNFLNTVKAAVVNPPEAPSDIKR